MKVLFFTALIGDLRSPISSDESDESHSAVAAAKPVPPVTAPAPAPATNQNVPTNPVKTPSKSADEMLKDVTVKGITRNGDKSMLLISANHKNYTLVSSEPTLVQMTSGFCRIRLVAVSANWATLEVNGQEIVLRIH